MVAAFLAGFLATALLLFPLHRYASRRLLDRPSSRSSHASPMPRGGGAALALAALALLPFLELSLAEKAALMGGFAVALIGWLDDHRSLPIPLRLAVQLLAGIWSLSWLPGPLPLPLSLLILVWFTNLYNFMDGIDGLAASQALLWCLILGLLAFQAGLTEAPFLALLAGGLLALLLWNWPRAELFMGDVGSYFLGFTLALLLLRLTAVDPKWGLLGGILTAPFWVDATWTLGYRLLSGQRWFLPHRLHAYQKLARRLGHRETTSLYLLFTLLWLLPAGLLVYGGVSAIMGLILAVGPLLGLVVALRAGDPQ